MKATSVLETDDTLQALFLKVGQLPQCQTVFLGNLEGPGFVNLLTGQVVGRRFVEPVSPSEEAEPDRTLEAVLVSYTPPEQRGHCSRFSDAQGRWREKAAPGVERPSLGAWVETNGRMRKGA